MEREQEQLAQRQLSSPQSADIALKQFLYLLVWFRRVLLQDCAILYSKYPSCPMFRCAPFNTATFRCFAATSLSIVDHAEEEVRHALKNLPEHVAATFRGLATDIKMDQRTQRIDSEARWDAVDSRLNQVTDLLHMLIGAKSSKGGRKTKTGNVHAVCIYSVHWPDFTLTLLSVSLPKASAAPAHEAFPPDTNAPCQPFPSPTTATIPNITINISNSSTGQYAVTAAPRPPTPSPHTNFTNISAEQQPCPKYQGQAMTPIQLSKWNSLIVKYGEARVYKHSWEWTHGDFLPFYVYQSVDRVTDYWTEWTEGIEGYLPTRELTEVWGAKWRRNNGGQRTECGRRKRVIDLMTTLSARPNWNINLAIRFLSEKYEKAYTPRKFCDWLKPENVQAVLVAAVTYCSSA